MIRKNIIFISLILTLISCGFTPLYKKNIDINFSIKNISYVGDRDLNNFLKTNLNHYKNEKKN